MDETTAVRFGVFAIVFAAMSLLEHVLPRRRRERPRLRRWPTNLGIVGCGIAAVSLLAAFGRLLALPLVAVAAAGFAESRGIGLLNLLAWPRWLELLLAVVVLDFAIWLQHVASHKVPMLWRFHRMHHADPEFDVTTALRFHPAEIALSMLYKVVWVLVLGPSVVAVIVFEVLLNACAMFNHGNVRLPAGLDRVLRLAVVTPDMHRVHHSIHQREHDTNYGFNLSIWDRMLSTYTRTPSGGHEGMQIGLADYRDEAPTRLGWCLALPFHRVRQAKNPAARSQDAPHGAPNGD